MKKVIIYITIVLLLGCAHHKPYTPPKNLGIRMTTIGAEVLTCLNAPVNFYIAKSKEQNAWIIDDKVYFTEGLFDLDDDTLKFVMAHEISHLKLNHLKTIKKVSYATTGVMMVVNFVIPGAGLLNYLVNPAVVNNFTKTQEYEADKLASKTCLCLGISIDRQVEILKNLKKAIADGGKFWDRHPSWDDRIANIKAPP